MMEEYQDQSLRGKVFQKIREEILSGVYQDGEELREVTLGEKLGVSRTPVREALRQLELEGLVNMVPRKGAEVADITEKSLRDVLEVRKALEELSVQLACEKITEEEIEELKRVAERFKDTLNDQDVTKIAEADVAFHDVIYTATDNQKLILLLNNLREQMYRYRLEYVKDTDYHIVLLNEHKELVDAIESGKKEEARQIMKKHITNQEMTVIRNIKEEY